MANVGAVITNIRNIMRQDRGISGDAQRLEQLGWMLFLKIIDDKDQELELIKEDYESVIPKKFQWRNWAEDTEGITGDELLDFIDRTTQNDKGLFATLSALTSSKNPKRASIVQQIFDGTNNFMKSGYEMRKVINELNKIDFNSSKDKQVFGTIYENILVELRDAGNKGEYYTPRAVTKLMTLMTDPQLGEKVLDPASGTAGFLTEAIDHVRENYVKTVDDEHILQNSITGWEFKPVPFVLGLTNLILHEIEIPDYHYIDSLKKEYNSIGKKDQVQVILANPPFGASIADGVETNFPATYRCKESADLFVILMLRLLKPNGRAAIVLPDGSITGDGVKERIREKLLTDCNLHTIIRLPQSTFHPATVSTNLLFFEKGSKTKEIWYYEHRLPKGQKSYSKRKPIQFQEFEPIMNWWNNRKESQVSWKVSVENLIDWNLDVKNPTSKQNPFELSSTEAISELTKSINESQLLLDKLMKNISL
ncbi:MAG: N-6 DNA methylase [Bacteroidota bacterium]